MELEPVSFCAFILSKMNASVRMELLSPMLDILLIWKNLGKMSYQTCSMELYGRKIFDK